MSIKWTENDGIFTPVTKDVYEVLPVGVYELKISWGVLYLTQRSIVTDDLTVMPGEAQQIVDNIDRFWASQELYKKHGLVYKRGVLLHGPPGTGKTSLVNIVCQLAHSKGAVCVLASKDLESFQDELELLKEHVGDTKLVILIEDVDQYLSRDEEILLELLDGATQIDNVVFLATTNHLEALPDRIKNRPSRFDMVVELGPPDAKNRSVYLEKLGVDTSDTRWVENTAGLTYAHLKELFLAVNVFGVGFDVTLARLKLMTSVEEYS